MSLQVGSTNRHIARSPRVAAIEDIGEEDDVHLRPSGVAKEILKAYPSDFLWAPSMGPYPLQKWRLNYGPLF